ncbi:MAG: hypothetical protein GY827_07565 [Cytophagales bacterium]|nr:hypothetical protein [Cytophagales bacterium]
MNEEQDGYVRMTDHPNLYNMALTMIKQKGFEVFLYPYPEDHESDMLGKFIAKKGNKCFDAEDPLRLLGMINIW